MPEVTPPVLDINNKTEFILRKASWLELVSLTLKCLILYYLEMSLKQESERLAIKAKQTNETAQNNKAEQIVINSNQPGDLVL